METEASLNSTHIMLSSMGISEARPTSYILDGRVEQAGFAAFAVWQLLPPESRPDEIWFLLTPQAQSKAWPSIQQEAAKLQVMVKSIELPNNAADDTTDFLEIAAESLPTGCRLTLDVTQGLRHHAFLFYALALYLSEFRGIAIGGAWYCRHETDDDDPKPVIDLKPVLNLAQWFHALAVFRDQGLSRRMSELLQSSVDELRLQAQQEGNDAQLHRDASDLECIVGALEKHSFAFATALPLELGKAARNVAERFPGIVDTRIGDRLPLVKHLANVVSKQAERTAFVELPQLKGKWKTTIHLDWDELQRQARIIDMCFDHGQIAQAVGLMREWVITWLMFRDGLSTGIWNYSARKPYEQRLGAIGALLKPGTDVIEPTVDQRELGAFWNQLSNDLRNSLMHNGMREESVEEPPTKPLTSVKEFWQRLKRNDVEVPRFGGGHGRLLICPIGLTPGVLFSALKHTHADRVLVIASAKSAQFIAEACSQAGSKSEAKTLMLNDIHRGITEFGTLIGEASLWLFEADEIHACLTGGTTLMGALVSKLNMRAGREYQRSIREFVLIDRRSPKEQQDTPWQLGDIHYLDDKPPENASDRTSESNEAPQAGEVDCDDQSDNTESQS